MKETFADAGYWIAVLARNDELHERPDLSQGNWHPAVQSRMRALPSLERQPVFLDRYRPALFRVNALQ